MKIRVILPLLAFLISFCSCSKETFLLSTNTGSYGGYHRTTETSANISNEIPKQNTEAAILTATTAEDQLNLNLNAATQVSSDLKIRETYKNENTAPEPILKKPENKKKRGLNYLLRSIHETNKVLPFEVTANNSESNVFSILSILFALAPILLSILIGSGIVYLLGIPAIIFGIIGLAKKEKLWWLALIGLILGLLEVSIIVIAFVILSKM